MTLWTAGHPLPDFTQILQASARMSAKSETTLWCPARTHRRRSPLATGINKSAATSTSLWVYMKHRTLGILPMPYLAPRGGRGPWCVDLGYILRKRDHLCVSWFFIVVLSRLYCIPMVAFCSRNRIQVCLRSAAMQAHSSPSSRLYTPY